MSSPKVPKYLRKGMIAKEYNRRREEMGYFVTSIEPIQLTLSCKDSGCDRHPAGMHSPYCPRHNTECSCDIQVEPSMQVSHTEKHNRQFNKKEHMEFVWPSPSIDPSQEISITRQAWENAKDRYWLWKICFFLCSGFSLVALGVMGCLKEHTVVKHDTVYVDKVVEKPVEKIVIQEKIVYKEPREAPIDYSYIDPTQLEQARVWLTRYRYSVDSNNLSKETDAFNMDQFNKFPENIRRAANFLEAQKGISDLTKPVSTE